MLCKHHAHIVAALLCPTFDILRFFVGYQTTHEVVADDCFDLLFPEGLRPVKIPFCASSHKTNLCEGTVHFGFCFAVIGQIRGWLDRILAPSAWTMSSHGLERADAIRAWLLPLVQQLKRLHCTPQNGTASVEKVDQDRVQHTPFAIVSKGLTASSADLPSNRGFEK